MQMHSKKMSVNELNKFVINVQKMRKYGMSLSAIAEYYCIHRNTVMVRLRKFESMLSKSMILK